MHRSVSCLLQRRWSLATRGVSNSSPSLHNVDVDVCIVGGGIVGSCVAAALKRAPRTRHLRVALIDNSWSTRLTPSSAHLQQNPAHAECRAPVLSTDSASVRDRRVYAISPASRQLLQAAGAWQLLPAGCVHDYDSMQARGSEVLQLRAADAAMDSLGSIVGHCDLQAALQQCVLATDVTCIGSAARTISSLPPAAAAAAGHVLTAGDFSVSCSLLVGCDGAASRVRSHSGIASAAINYSSNAVVATLQLSASTTTAYQRFLSTGPIAMLPLDAGWASLVWTLPVPEAARVVALPAEELVARINEAFYAHHEQTATLPPLVLGIQGKPAAIPLQLMQACRMQHNSIVLVGDAAHSVHPLAGQGLNLGLHDALSLVAHMSRSAAAGGAVDDFVALQAYERERLLINAAWGAAIDVIGRVFGVQSSAVAVPRGLALTFMNAFTPMKQQIIAAASGDGDRHLENLQELK